MNEQYKRYYEIVKRINAGQEVSNDDLEFFAVTSPEIDEAKILSAAGTDDPQIVRSGLLEAQRKLMNDPVFKDRLLKTAATAKGKKTADQISQGVSLLLGGIDVASSINQINQSKQSLKKTVRPYSPAIPRRDQLLQQALRSAQEGNFDTERAIAPVRNEIQNQYLNDIANAKTASTGQAGAYGAYAQIAANRRNQGALQLAPIQDQIRRGQQANYNQLLGMRADETQNRFANQNRVFNTELDQYGEDVKTHGALGSQGRTNLRNSLYNLGTVVPNAVQNIYADRQYRNLRNKLAAAYGQEVADIGVGNREYLDRMHGSTMTVDDTPDYWNQMYGN